MVSLVTLVVFLLWFRSSISRGNLKDKRLVYAVLAMECFGLVLSGISFMKEFRGDDVLQSLSRPTIGEGSKTYSIIGKSDSGEDTVEVKVSEAAVTKKEAEKIAQLAMTEIDETFLGENPSAEEITKPIVMKDSYQNGQVTANWELQAPGIIDPDGTPHPEKLKEPAVVAATVWLRIQEYSFSYQMHFCVCPYASDSQEGKQAAIQKALEKSDQETKDQKDMDLPTSIAGNSVTWYVPADRTGEWISILGLFLGLGMILGKYRDEQKKENDRQLRLERDYPQIVSELSLYIGAGIPAKSAFLRMAQSYEKGKETGQREREGYEEVVKLCHRMQDGEGEKAAYEGFAARCNNRHYRKLTLLLTQNLRQGNAKMTELLEQEELSAAELQRTQALARGEVASTKLLIPLVGLLGIILVLIGLPALFIAV